MTESPWWFVGDGRSIPALGLDDYAAREVRGQTVIILADAPVLMDMTVDSIRALESAGRYDGPEERPRITAALSRGVALVVMVVSEERWRERHRFIAQPNAHNTWMQGMRQMLLGYAMGQDPTGREPNHWHDIEPYGDIAGLDATLAGSLARLLEKLQQQLIILSETTTPAYWYDRMETMLLDFFDCEDAEDTALLESWLSILLQWRNTCLKLFQMPSKILSARWFHPVLRVRSRALLAGSVSWLLPENWQPTIN